MEIVTGSIGKEQAIIDLFAATFTVSEGADEGKEIASLIQDLVSQTPDDDIRVFRAEKEGRVIGAVVFTRLRYPDDPHHVVLLSPMAVAHDCQRQGIGKTLIRHALGALRAEGVDVAITYGDPNYYGRAGFVAITEQQARPPLPLSYPHGWVGQSLTGPSMPDLKGSSTCVTALNRTDVW